MHLRPRTVLLLVCLTLLAGCGGSDSGDGDAGGGSSSSGGTPSTGATSSLPASASQSSPGGSGSPSSRPSGSGSGSGSASVTASPSQAGPPECSTPALRITVAPAPGGGTAGTTYDTITFTNRSVHRCVIAGYPVVTLVHGPSQVGAAAAQANAEQQGTFTLEPGDAATATLSIADPGALPGCRPTAVDGIRVSPPGSRQSITVATQTKGCADRSAPLLSVFPVSSPATP